MSARELADRPVCGVRRGDKWRGFAELDGGVRATFEGYVQVTELRLFGEGIARDLDYAGNRESPPTTPTPHDSHRRRHGNV